MSRSFAFVETLNGIEAARANSSAAIGTDNPLLAHDPKAGGGVQDISALLDQEEATRLGRGVIDMLLALDAMLERAGAAAHYGGRPGPLNITMALRALTATLVLRGVMAQRALAEFGAGALSLIVPDQPRWHAAAPWNLPRYGSPHRSLAEAGFFGERPVEFIPVAFTPTTDFNDTSTDDLWLRVLLVPPAQALFELAKRMRLVGFNGRGRVAVGKTSETLNETLPWLALRGTKFGKFQLPSYPGPQPPAYGKPCPADAWLEQHAGAFLAERVANLGAFPERSARAVATVVLQHLSAVLHGLAGIMKAIDAAIERSFEGASSPKILATSGVYGPAGVQLHASCLAHDVTLVDFEHGATTGLSHTAERRLQVCEATTSDILMACSPRAAESFRRAPAKRCDVRVIGLADQTRKVFWPRLQRARARARLRLNGAGAVVMHVSGLLYGGNMRVGDDTSVERYVFAAEKTLLCDVYGAVNKTVLYKPYPTQRFPHDASYAELFPLPRNVRLIDRADFRYVRAAADVIVTDAGQSTLGWCMGAGVPMVRLSSRIVQSLASEELDASVAEAFFTVDVDRPGWKAALIELLNRDIADLRREWQDKGEKRKRFLPGAVFGPPGSVGRRAAKIVAGLHG